MAHTDETLPRFAIVGALVAGLYVLLYLILQELGLGAAVANTVAFLIAVSAQYVGQAAFTFRVQLRNRQQIVRFVVMIGLGLVTSTTMTALLGPALGLADWISAVAVTLVLPVQNFVLMRLWVFDRLRNERKFS